MQRACAQNTGSGQADHYHSKPNTAHPLRAAHTRASFSMFRLRTTSSSNRYWIHICCMWLQCHHTRFVYTGRGVRAVDFRREVEQHSPVSFTTTSMQGAPLRTTDSGTRIRPGTSGDSVVLPAPLWSDTKAVGQVLREDACGRDEQLPVGGVATGVRNAVRRGSDNCRVLTRCELPGGVLQRVRVMEGMHTSAVCCSSCGSTIMGAIHRAKHSTQALAQLVSYYYRDHAPIARTKLRTYTPWQQRVRWLTTSTKSSGMSKQTR